MLAGSPLQADCVTRRTGCAARGKPAHPIDSFDKTGQRTLETFNTLAVETDCNVSAWRNEGRA
jgi:hypothetical protein